MKDHYVIQVINDIEPELHGPVRTRKAVLKTARKLRADNGEEHGIFHLIISRTGQPSIHTFSGKELE